MGFVAQRRSVGGTDRVRFNVHFWRFILLIEEYFDNVFPRDVAGHVYFRYR